MPETKTTTPPENGVSTGSGSDRATANATDVDGVKHAVVTTPPAATADDKTSKGNDVGSSPGPAKVTNANEPASKRRLNKFVPLLVLALAALILFGIAGGWSRWVGSGTQTTDDAILRADITPLSTRVSGTVVQVAVADYQRVKAGDLLVQLKDDDFKAQVAQAEAGVAAAQAALESNSKQKDLQNSRIVQARRVSLGSETQHTPRPDEETWDRRARSEE